MAQTDASIFPLEVNEKKNRIAKKLTPIFH